MYISEVTLNNFRCHSMLVVPLERFNVLIGANGNGKSSVLEAITYATQGVVASGATKKELIKTNCKNGYVNIKFDNNYTLYRELSGTVSAVKLKDENGTIISDKIAEIENWFNIPKEIFMNIVYAPQGEIYQYFMKFNAKQKDFMDSLFNIDGYVSPTLEKLKSTREIIDQSFLKMNAIEQSKAQMINHINSQLSQLGYENLEQLEVAVNSLYEQLNSLADVTDVVNTQNKLTSVNGQYNMVLSQYQNITTQSIPTTIEEDPRLQQYQEKLEQLCVQMSTCFGTQIVSTTNPKQIEQLISEKTDLKKCLSWCSSYIESMIKMLTDSPQTDISIIKNGLNELLKGIKYIEQIDSYRQSFYNFLASLNELNRNITSLKNEEDRKKRDIENKKLEVERITNQVQNLKVQVETLSLELKEKLSQYPDISDYNQYLSLAQTQRTRYNVLHTNAQNIKSYLTELNKLQAFDPAVVEKYKMARERIVKMEQLFGRDGFCAALRQQFLTDLAISLEEMLENFGFGKLTPVDLTSDGSFLFGGKTFRSLSGGQKMVTAIIQRVVYSRMLAPTMKLSILMADEPTSELDSVRVDELREFLDEISKTLAVQVIIVTHNPNVIPPEANVISL